MALKTVELELDGSSRRTRKAAKAFHEGWEHQKARRWRQAIMAYDRAIAIDRTLFAAFANRGMCWYQISESERALRDYDQAWKIGSPHLRGIAGVNRGVLLASLRRYDEALADFAADDSFEAKLNAAYIELMRGNFERGLELYAERPTKRLWKTQTRTVADLAGKSVLVLHEQGFGDSIMMARFVPEIAAVAKSVHWTTRTALMPLLAQNFPNVTFSDGNDVKAAALKYRHDETVLVMDLWQTCGLKIDGRPYLKADPVRVAKMRAALPVDLKIGLSWRGRTEFANDHNRSASLADLRSVINYAPLRSITLQNPETTIFVSLQKDLRDDERSVINYAPLHPITLFDGGALINDFADSAALMSCLDALITVDTATAHLGGALGIKTAVLLPFAADWRWGPEGDTTPWYDSVRLFRQRAFGQWAEPVAAAAQWCVAG